MRRVIALVVAGAILGAAGMNLYLAARIDELYITREKFKIELYETEERLKKLEDQWQNHRALVIREVVVEFSQQDRDSFVEIRLQEAVSRLTHDLIGEEPEKIPHSLVVHLLDGRIIEVEEKRYQLQVKTVILAETVTYVLRYVPQNEQSDDEP
ncbi:MAG: hypothetical protein SCK29_08550 [Bacillota bacterium]|nr:hypothetical protein [Bacillota bacterium]MDW7684148.1 hypothetical protein [Bacillota bacterium]